MNSFKIIRFRRKGNLHNPLYDLVVCQRFHRINQFLLKNWVFLILNAFNDLI